VELEPAAPQAIHRIMTTLLEAFAENFDEYTEYHATTSKADRGELTYVLLDFLRLRCEYHRVAWNLWPFVLAHSAIVQQGLKQVAQLWESRLANRVRDRAAYFLSRLQEMEDQYGVALPSVRETIQEQFVRPLQVNYLLGHARAVREQVDGSGANAAFTQMEGTCERLIAEVTGAHRNLPEWLERISRLVQPDDAHRSADLAIADVGNMPHIPPPNLDSIVDQVQKWRATLPSLNSSEGEAVP